MIVLDTTVLVYAKGSDHPLRDPCRRIMGAVASGEIAATTTPEVIQEFAHVRARRRDRADAASLARDYAEILAPLIQVGQGVLERGLGIFAADQSVGVFDAVLIAAALEAGASELVSADRALADVGAIATVFPDRVAVESLLATAP